MARIRFAFNTHRNCRIGRGLILFLGVFLPACGGGDPAGPSPPEAKGIAVEYVSTALHYAAGVRDWTTHHFSTWVTQYGPDEPDWSYDDDMKAWRRFHDAQTDVQVSDQQGDYIIRTRDRSSVAVSLLRGDREVRSWILADSVSFVESASQSRYIVQEGYTLDDPHDLTLDWQGQAVLVDGSVALATVSGILRGWEIFPQVEANPDTFHYEGRIDLEAVVVNDDWDCAGFELSVDLEITDTKGQAIDRYAGSFSVDVDGDLYAGTARSRQGNGSYRIVMNRDCGD